MIFNESNLRSILQAGSSRLESRHTAIRFQGRALVSIGLALGGTLGVTMPAETRYLTNYLSGKTSFLPGKTNTCGYVQLDRRDTGVIDVFFQDNNMPYTSSRSEVDIIGVKAIGPDLVSESSYIYALETIARAQELDRSNTGLSDTVTTAVETASALFHGAGSLDIANKVNKLTELICNNIETAEAVIDQTNSVTTHVNGSPRIYNRTTTEPTVVKAMIASANIEKPVGSTTFQHKLVTAASPRRSTARTTLENVEKLIARSSALSAALASASSTPAAETTTGPEVASAEPAPASEPVPEPVKAKPEYPSEHLEYIKQSGKFYGELVAGKYNIDIDEFAPFIKKCYEEAGETITDEEFDALLKEAKLHIPPVGILDSYLPIKDFQTMVLAIRNNLTDTLAVMKQAADKGEKIPYNALMRTGVKNWYLVGPPGAGKSISAQAVAAAIGLPFYSVGASRNVEEDMFQGGLGIKNGKQDNVTTPYVEGIHGLIPSIISVEEINALSPGVALTLNAHCENPYSINLYGQQMVRRNPGAFIIASGNRDLAGLQEQNTALLSRFQSLDIEAPSVKQIKSIAAQIVPQASPEAVDYVCDAFTSVIDAVKKNSFDIDRDELLTGITIRGVGQALNLITLGVPPVDATKSGILSTVVSQSKDSYKILADTITNKPAPDLPEASR